MNYINTLTHEQKTRVIKECNRLARGGEPKHPRTGLCTNIDLTTNVSGCVIVEELSPSWKHFSGCNVCDMEGHMFIYELSKNSGALWLGEQGKHRRSLARHIAKKLKETL